MALSMCDNFYTHVLIMSAMGSPIARVQKVISLANVFSSSLVERDPLKFSRIILKGLTSDVMLRCGSLWIYLDYINYNLLCLSPVD